MKIFGMASIVESMKYTNFRKNSQSYIGHLGSPAIHSWTFLGGELPELDEAGSILVSRSMFSKS
jgi:hypothetical protein